MSSNKKILIVDDEQDILDLLKFHVKQAGHSALSATSGESALRLAREEKPDLIILDLMLPGIGGLDVCRILKTDPAIASLSVIMLTAKGEEQDIVKGLNLGADDYVTKPFSPKVLMARVERLLKRYDLSKDKSPALLEYREIKMDLGKRKVLLNNETIPLTFTEFEILNFLIQHPGWVFTRNDIVDNVRGDNYPVTDRSVDVQIVGLRKKLAEAGKYIETVRGVGYRMQEL